MLGEASPLIVGEYMVDSGVVSVDRDMSRIGRFDLGSEADLITADPAWGSSVVNRSGCSSLGETSVVLWSFSCASRPSTLFSNASSTSVFGPRFLGIASINHVKSVSCF